MAVSKYLAGMAALAALAALAGSGCATKKFVRQQTVPLAERVAQVDKKHTDALAELEQKEGKDISRVDERAIGAENKAGEAARAAKEADAKALAAAEVAKNAANTANGANARLGELSNFVENIDRFKLLAAEDVQFGFDKTVLSPEAKQKLDQLAGQATSSQRCVIEVQGFTDRAGAADYNLALSRRRADVVVRYLVEKGVPLRSIHTIGLGTAAAPVNQEVRLSRREAAKAMRRVTVSLYTPEVSLAGGTSSSQTAGNLNKLP